MNAWWSTPDGTALVQGELIRNFDFPRLDSIPTGSDRPEMKIIKADCIILTQSCDLENRKVNEVLLCKCYSLRAICEIHQHYKDIKMREDIRKGNVYACCMLTSPDNDEDPEENLIVDFKSVVSVSREYLMQFIEINNVERVCLVSPYTEYLSQAFAKFFMRVALPVGIESFKKK
ncbi:hypothetical protein [Gimesia chilikensis]|nr:hypothetical protein [Gimesia chilikensis]